MERGTYLTHINGLRAVAILGVIFYHLRADYCPAGYFGVDLFLVISGYFLFRSLLQPGAAQEFHYGNYLLKKAWRILPSWFVVTLATCILSLVLFPIERLPDVFKTARSSAFFYADYYIDESGNYFNAYSQQNPLLHFWYLSITQQLYIVVPILIFPLARWVSRRAVVILLAVAAILSFAYYVATTAQWVAPSLRDGLLQATGVQTAYYHLVPRFWEIAAAAGIGLLPVWESRPRLRASLGMLALVGMVASFFLYHTGSSSVYLAVISSLMLIRYASIGWVAAVLACKPLQALGTISFSLYLWHWPVMVFWKYICLDMPDLWDEAGMLSLSLLLGVLGWFLLERIRIPSRAGWKGTLLRCSLLLTILLVNIPASKINRYVRRQLDAELAAEAQAAAKPHVLQPQQETDESVLEGLKANGIKIPALRLGAPDARVSFILLGDSHAQHIYDAMHEKCVTAGIRGFMLKSNVTPNWNLNQTGNGFWSQQVAEGLLQYLRGNEHVSYVIIAQYWQYRLTGLYRDFRPVTAQLLDTEPLVDNLGQECSTGKMLTTPRERLRVTEPGVGLFCDQIRALGRDVVLLGDNPTFGYPSPIDEWRRCERLRKEWKPRFITPEEHERMQEISHRVLRNLAKEGRAHYIDLAPAMLVNGVYPARDEASGEFLYKDNDHLSSVGSQRVVDYLMPRLLEWMKACESRTGRVSP